MNSHPHASRCTCSICRPDKYHTPIINAVKRMYADNDTRQIASRGYNPYHHGTRRFTGPDSPTTPEQREQAEQNLACYETELTLAAPSASKSASGAIQE